MKQRDAIEPARRHAPRSAAGHAYASERTAAPVDARATAQRTLADAITRSALIVTQQAAAARITESPRMLAQRRLAAELQRAPVQSGLGVRPLQRAPAEQGGSARAAGTAAKTGSAGLPAKLKSGIEALSGMAMDNVRVHYNSARPAQLHALAYAQGTNIHLAPGQERHLPHEAWHVVQQAQGRVRPTMQMKDGVPVNDDRTLEREADAMGARALQLGERGAAAAAPQDNARPPPRGARSTAVQRAIGFEFETGFPILTSAHVLYTAKNEPVMSSVGWRAVGDSGHLEFVTEPVDETQPGFNLMQDRIKALAAFALKVEKYLADVKYRFGDSLGASLLNSVSKRDPEKHGIFTIGVERAGATVDVLAALDGLRADLGDHWLAQSSNGLMNAAPQATGAIRLERVPALIEQTTQNPQFGRSAAEQQEMAESARRARELRVEGKSGKDVQFGERFTGFLTLVIAYLRVPVRVAEIDQELKDYYPKDMPLLSRTHLGELALSAFENMEEGQFLADPAALFKASGLEGSVDDHMFPRGYDTRNGHADGPTRRQFLHDLAQGRDWFAGSNDPGRASMGSMRMGGERVITDEQPPPDRAIIELRRLAMPVHASEWLNTVIAVFRMIHSVNK